MKKTLLSPVISIGEWILGLSEGAGHGLTLLAQTVYWLRAVWVKRSDIMEKMAVGGLGSAPVALFVALFTGMTLALQAGHQLAKFNQEQAIGALVTATMLREMGPVMTAIILSAMVGSSYAAELGTMSVSEEIDALRVMSISPVKYLVMPRVLAMAIMAPILTIMSDVLGILGGAFVGRYVLGIDYQLYFDAVRWVLTVGDAAGGMVKAFVFGITLSIVGCSYGLRATRGAEGVGKATMKAVVISFVLILLFNYFLTWIFYPPM
jgi:phospholipid/cholesterol/gamma-HCH transport system permease protein